MRLNSSYLSGYCVMLGLWGPLLVGLSPKRPCQEILASFDGQGDRRVAKRLQNRGCETPIARLRATTNTLLEPSCEHVFGTVMATRLRISDCKKGIWIDYCFSALFHWSDTECFLGVTPTPAAGPQLIGFPTVTSSIAL
jgi:hypothetical protein